MRYLLISVVLFSLGGCGDMLKKDEIDAAQIACEQNGGVKQIYCGFLNSATAYCNNGASFSLSFEARERLLKE